MMEDKQEKRKLLLQNLRTQSPRTPLPNHKQDLQMGKKTRGKSPKEKKRTTPRIPVCQGKGKEAIKTKRSDVYSKNMDEKRDVKDGPSSLEETDKDRNQNGPSPSNCPEKAICLSDAPEKRKKVL